MTNLDKIIKELEEANKKRTKARWVVANNHLDGHTADENFTELFTAFKKCDAEFIALAANNLPKLLEAVKLMRDGLDNLKTRWDKVEGQSSTSYLLVEKTLAEVEELFK